ncbi:hypothetical protein PUMCH_004914 [Australozyma saopauloensis]|uniref:Uncharacterized protein n=1 Tax=Australozyma saopauloensis TaxID=291208 RepID=A0AAX4HGK5_9ASCO|nr:hypothetical protein PUMCH_004914 [[Candida] saopauloensis]
MGMKSGPGRSIGVPVTVLLKLHNQLRQTVSKTVFSRKFYAEINDKILASLATLDKTLYFICYFTLLLSSILNNKQKIRTFLASQRTNLLKVVDKYSLAVFQKSLLKRGADASKATKLSTSEKESATETVAVDGSSEKGSVEAVTPAVPSNLAVHLKAVSSYISDVRIFNRLTDAIKYMPWIIDEFGALMNPALAVPRLDRFINFAQAINCLVLELLENAGWLTDHNWVGTPDNNYWCIETYIWCSRVWGAYILIEIIELFRRTPKAKRNKDWRIALFTQVVQLPLVVHWSLYEGCLSPFWVGLFGSGASWFGFKNTLLSIDLS